MTRFNKIRSKLQTVCHLARGVMLGMSGLAYNMSAHAQHAQSGIDADVASLITYAGPQSVSPTQTIYVTVQASTAAGYNIDNQFVELSYDADGKTQSQTKNMTDGLVSFELPAQKTAGLMRFTATLQAVTSIPVAVVVAADVISPFTLKVNKIAKQGAIEIQSDVIRDPFGNLISNMALVKIDWLDGSGLRQSQHVQLTTGRIILNALCPQNFTAPLTIRAVLMNVETVTQDLSNLCLHKR